MKTQAGPAPSLPAMPTIVLISLVFSVPLAVWGNRWPWLAAIPVGIIVLATVRSELQRLRRHDAQWEAKGRVRVVGVLRVPATIESEVTFSSFSAEDAWTAVSASEARQEIRNNVVSIGHHTYRKASDERFAAIA